MIYAAFMAITRLGMHSRPDIESIKARVRKPQIALVSLNDDLDTWHDLRQLVTDANLDIDVTLPGVINILDPHVVVLGGGVSNVDALYTRGIEALAPWVFNDTVQTRIVRNELGDSAGVFGAAMLVA